MVRVLAPVPGKYQVNVIVNLLLQKSNVEDWREVEMCLALA